MKNSFIKKLNIIKFILLFFQKINIEQEKVEQNLIEEELPKEVSMFEIKLSKEKNFFKLYISDYISQKDFCDTMKELNFLEMLSNSVIWNSRIQKVNKGTYYIIPKDNFLYNILLNENSLKIDERIQINDEVEERIISIIDNKFHYTVFKHDKTGSTYYTKYYNPYYDLGELNLTKAKFLEEITFVLNNLKRVDNITEIIDFSYLESKIQESLEEKNSLKLT